MVAYCQTRLDYCDILLKIVVSATIEEIQNNHYGFVCILISHETAKQSNR